MFRSIAVLLLCGLAPLHAQINLPAQSKGQLPPTNAQQVLQLTPQGGAHRGYNATTGYTESFFADEHCAAGTSNATGFDYSSNLSCTRPGFYNATAGNTFDLERTFAYGVTNGQPPAPTVFSLTASADWQNVSIGSIGVSTCAVGAYNCGTANDLYITWNGNGLYLYSAGTSTLLWNAGGNTGGNAGTTDSSVGLGWAAPSLGALYVFTLTIPGDGTAIVSAMPAGTYMGDPCNSAGCSFVARVPFTPPAGSFHQFFVRGGANEYISDVSASDGFAMVNGATPVYLVNTDPRVHVARALRWALHSDGTECNYTSIASDCTNVYALIPANYNPNVANPWYLQVRGQENSTISFYGDYSNDNPTLFTNGLVAIYGDWHGATYYGAPHDLQDVVNALAKVKSALSLADRGTLTADSAGGIIVTNLVTHNLIIPKDIICYSCNLNLYSDVAGDNTINQQNGSGQLGLIATDYGFTDTGAANNFSAIPAYYTYTAGFDPILVLQNPLKRYVNTIFDATYPLAPNAAQLLASIPFLAISDQAPGDAGVNVTTNSVLFCTLDNTVNPGICTNVYIGGGHVSANKFVGTTALNWINSH